MTAIHVPIYPTLAEAMEAEGLPLPNECADVQLLTPVDGGFQLRYVINLTPEQMVKIGKALIRMFKPRFWPCKESHGNSVCSHPSCEPPWEIATELRGRPGTQDVQSLPTKEK